MLLLFFSWNLYYLSMSNVEEVYEKINVWSLR